MKAESENNKRKRAGKPAFFGSPMKRKNIMIDDARIEKAFKLGNGNLSEGIRKAIDDIK